VTGNSLDPASERVLLEFPIQRDECCHSSGSLDFDAQGNLYLTTGDNTNPFASSGYTPIDERAGRSSWDAQRTSANTSDLRGKLLRIHPEADGTYTVPAGNLFAPGTLGARPEIYAMGFRNPFRMTVDPETGWVYLADYGPDATAPDAARGPAGYVEWTQIRAPGNFGWPYCHGNQFPYNDYDFATGTSGALFDCAAPVNESPNNTGLRELPPAQPPDVWYSYGLSAEFPELETGCGCPMAGPVYHFDANLVSERKFPAYFDDTPFFFEWGRNFIKEFKQDESGALLDILPFLPTETYLRPMDMTFGPDGAMYLLEWGTGFGGANPDSGLYRIDYVKGTRRPIVVATGTPDSGGTPLTVQFSSAGTRDPDAGDQLTYAWDFQSDGTVDSTDPNPSFTYTTAGNFTAQLTVTDTSNKTGVANVEISAGNTRPTVTIQAPPDGGFFDFGDQVAYDVAVTDPEDPTVNCSAVRMAYLLGHDAHAHELTSQSGCSGIITTASDDGHGAAANLFGVLEATYTDTGATGVAPLTGRAQVVLQPKRKQAEHFTQNQGAQLESTSDQGGGQNIGFLDHGDYVSYDPMNLANIDSLVYRAASGGSGGTIEVHVDSPSGPLVSTSTIQPTGRLAAVGGLRGAGHRSGRHARAVLRVQEPNGDERALQPQLDPIRRQGRVRQRHATRERDGDAAPGRGPAGGRLHGHLIGPGKRPGDVRVGLRRRHQRHRRRHHAHVPDVGCVHGHGHRHGQRRAVVERDREDAGPAGRVAADRVHRSGQRSAARRRVRRRPARRLPLGRGRTARLPRVPRRGRAAEDRHHADESVRPAQQRPEPDAADLAVRRLDGGSEGRRPGLREVAAGRHPRLPQRRHVPEDGRRRHVGPGGAPGGAEGRDPPRDQRRVPAGLPGGHRAAHAR